VNLGVLGVLALLLYLVALAVVTEIARRARADRSPADHFLAGRTIGPFVLFLTFYATAYSGNSLLGYPGEAYRRGFAWIMSTGFMLAIIVAFHVLVPKLRPIAIRESFVSPGDWVRHRFGGEPGGRVLLVAVALLMTIASANFLLAQMVAMGTVTAQVTNELVPYWLGVVGLAGVILAYETVGGMRAVAWTDSVQGGLMVLALGAVCARIVWEENGLGGLTDAVAAVRPSAVAVPSGSECVNWMSSIVLLGLASVVYPQMIQRLYAARSGRALAQSMAMMTFMPLVTTTVVALIGLAAIPRFQNLENVAADSVMPLLLNGWAAEGGWMIVLVVVVFMGALAAIMSTADSILLSLGSLISEDLLGRPGNDPATTVLGKRAAAIVMGIAVAIALLPRLTLWRLIELKMSLLIQCVPVFLLAIHWPALRARPLVAGIVAGTLTAVMSELSGVARLGGVHVGVIGLAVNVVVVCAAAAFESPATKPAHAGAAIDRSTPAAQ